MQMRLIPILTFLGILISFSKSFSQVLIKEIEASDPYDKGIKYVFPQVVLTSNPTISYKINKELALEILDIDIDTVKKSIFENIWSLQDDPSVRAQDFEYKLLANTKTLFSIEIDYEGCGAYCEYNQHYYSFDLRNGNRLDPTLLLNIAGQKILLDSLNLKRKKMINTRLLQIKKELIAKESLRNRELRETLKEEQALLNECRAREPYTNFEYTRFYCTPQAIFFQLDRCSAHYNRAIDEIGDFKISFNLKYWRKYLTRNGVEILTN